MTTDLQYRRAGARRREQLRRARWEISRLRSLLLAQVSIAAKATGWVVSVGPYGGEVEGTACDEDLNEAVKTALWVAGRRDQ